jgi:hypothetical protein
MSIVIDLENKNLLDEQTATLVKTLILEESIEIFKLINSYFAKAISLRELSHRLANLA